VNISFTGQMMSKPRPALVVSVDAFQKPALATVR